MQNSSTTTPRRWMNTSDAAAYMGCSATLLNRDRITRTYGIPFTNIGRRVVYDVNDLDAYLERRKQYAAVCDA